MPTNDSLKRAARTFVIAFLVILVPGGLGLINSVSAWAASNGQTAFPDWHNATYLLVSAVTAGFIAVGNLIVNWLEDATGKPIGR